MISKFRFPAGVFLAAWLVYAITLSRGVTLESLPLTAQLAGWDWQPMTSRPVFWLITLPFRLLPAGWMAMVLNLFSAFCAALTLGLLARSVELLPWKRSAGGSADWRAKIPALLACVICGLEFNFWREATAATGATFDVLLLAITIWCLLEFRKSEEPRWLDGAILTWGLVMANNCLMVLFLPPFLVVLIWLKRYEFLERRFLIRSAVLLAAGLGTYAILPLAHGLNPHSPWSFGHAWFMSLMSSRHVFGNTRAYFWYGRRVVGLALVVYYVIAGLPFLVRFENQETRFKSTSQQFQIWAHRCLRVALMALFLWLAFDPLPGPRQLVRQQTGFSLALLSFDYLTALSVGYIAGEHLVFSLRNSRRERRRSREPREPNGRESGNAAIIALISLAVLLAVALLFRNASAIGAVNRLPLESFGNLAVKSLPAGGGIVLSDEPERLLAFQAALSHRRDSRDWLAVNARSLPQPDYRRALERQSPGWFPPNSAHELSSLEMLTLLDQQVAAHRVFYLNPSFGYFFERFYLRPTGFIYEMKKRPAEGGNPPSLTPGEVEADEKFWTDAWQDRLNPLVQLRERDDFGKGRGGWKWLERIGVVPAVSQPDRLPTFWGSIGLNAWGVALQRLNLLKPARERFEQSRLVRTNNLVARFNLECNTNLVNGARMGLEDTPLAAKSLGDDEREIGLVLERCGPFDHPVFCYLMGCTFQKSGLLRQAADEFERAAALAPEAIAPQVLLAEVYSSLRLEAKVLDLVKRLRPVAKLLPATNTLDVQLSVLEAGAWMSQTNSARARQILQGIITEHPGDDGVLDTVARAYVAFGDFTNALQIVKEQNAAHPDNADSLLRTASILLLMNKPVEAIPLFDRVVALSPTAVAYLSRATAFMAMTNLVAAEADYREAEARNGDFYLVHYGLAELALRRKDDDTAVREFANCLTNSPEGTPRWNDCYARLKAIKAARDAGK